MITTAPDTDKLFAIVGAQRVDQTSPNVWRVRPNTELETAALVTFANHNRMALSVVGNATRGGAASSIERATLLLDMTQMNHVLRLDEESLTVHVQAGMSASLLEEQLHSRGLSLGDIPPTILRSTVGGLLAVRTPGKSSRRHGTFEDGVLGISAVLPDGQLIHTRVAPRRATGPDIARTICGSEGTLGVITSAVLRLHRRPESRLLSAFALRSFADGLAATRLALREEASPSAMRLYDRAAAQLHFGDTENHETILVAATAGPTDLAACDRDLISSAVHALSGHAIPERYAQLWWQRRSQSERHNFEEPSIELSASPAAMLPIYETLLSESERQGLEYFVHASRFDLDGGIIFARFERNGARVASEDEQCREIANACVSAGAIPLGLTQPPLPKHFARLQSLLDEHGMLRTKTIGAQS